MSRLQELQAAKAKRQAEAVLLSIYGGLENAVEHSGGILTGINIKFSGFEGLMTLKAEFPGGNMVSFCGASDLPGLFVKATTQAGSDGLKWREDEFFNVKGDDSIG